MSIDEDRREYSTRLLQYGEALRAGSPTARLLLSEAEQIWLRICSVGGAEAENREMHLVLAFTQAVTVGAVDEAKRLYESMSVEYQRQTNVADARFSLSPGSIKIWLRRRQRLPPFADLVLEQSDPMSARRAADYEYWKHQCAEVLSGSNLASLGYSCECIGRFDEGLEAYRGAAALAIKDGNEQLLMSTEERIRILSGAEPA